MIKVGCCGYPVNRKKYQETFQLVEINRTFYGYPKPQTVIRWREEAPEAFEFTVKAHQDISHKYKLRLEQSLEPFRRMKEICRVLRASILLIQTPASFTPNNLPQAETFFREAVRNGISLVWETRGPLWEETENRKLLKNVLAGLDVSHVTDPFRTMPVYTNQTVYFRLHGSGERMYCYQYTNKELKELYSKVKPLEKKHEQVYVLFNNLSMFEDATRFLTYLSTGSFPSLNASHGVESVKAIVARTKYPATKNVLMKKLGWRLVEFADGKQIRLAELLENIPSGTYRTPEDVLKHL